MEQRVSMNSLKKGFRTYINSRSGKPLKSISKRTRKAALRLVSFLGSSEVPLLCVVQG